MPHSPFLDPDAVIHEIDNRSLDSLALRDYISFSLGDQENWPLSRWDVSHLGLAAWYYNPEMSISTAKLKIAHADLLTAQMFPNPLFEYNPLHDTHLPTGTSPWTVAGYLEFYITRLLYRPFQIQEAEDKYLAAGFHYIQTAWNVRSQLLQNLIKVLYMEENISLYGKQLELIGQSIKLTEERLSSGEVSRLELRMSLLTKYQMEIQLQKAKQQLDLARIDLASSLGLPICALNCIAIDFKLYSAHVDFDLGALRYLALTHRADILEALYNVSAAHAALQYQIARQIPDLKLGPSYEYDQGVHEWGVILDFPLPLFNSNEGPIAQAAAGRNLAAAQFEAVQFHVLTEIDQAIENYKASLRQQIESLAYLKETQKNKESAEIRFAKGEIGRLELINAMIATVTAEEICLTIRSQLQRALVHLEQVLQYPLNGDADILCD